MIGKNEETILLAALASDGQATAADIYRKIEAAFDQLPPSFGAVFTTLNRMAKKGWVSVSIGQDDKGKDRKYFQVTMDGRNLVRQNIQVSRNLLDGDWSLA